MRKYIGLIALLSVCSCTPAPSLQSRMASYIGASESTLIQKLGVPDKQITSDGVTYLAYTTQHEQEDPGFIAFNGIYGEPYFGPYYGGPFFAGGFAPSISVTGCETTFMLHGGKVFNFTMRGDDCG